MKRKQKAIEILARVNDGKFRDDADAEEAINIAIENGNEFITRGCSACRKPALDYLRELISIQNE